MTPSDVVSHLDPCFNGLRFSWENLYTGNSLGIFPWFHVGLKPVIFFPGENPWILIVGEASAELIQDFHSLTWLPPVKIQEIKHEHELETYSLAVLDDHLPEKFPAFHCFPTFEAQKDEVLIISNIDGLSSQLRDRSCNKQLNSWMVSKNGATPFFGKPYLGWILYNCMY